MGTNHKRSDALIRVLLDGGAKVSTEWKNPRTEKTESVLETAIRTKVPKEIVTELINRGAKITTSCLEWACQKNQADIAEILLQNGADPCKKTQNRMFPGEASTNKNLQDQMEKARSHWRKKKAQEALSASDCLEI